MRVARASLTTIVGIVCLVLLPPAGARARTLAEIPVCTAAGNQELPGMVSDGAGGALMTWSDSRGGSSRVYAQRVNSAGVPQWASDGVALCSNAAIQQLPAITTDGAGGAIVAWEDSRGAMSHVYAQRISAGGVVQWAPAGVLLCTDSHGEVEPAIVSDGAGGAIAVWVDSRSGNNDVYAQRLSAAGVVQWAAGGVPLGAASGPQNAPFVVSDDAGGAIVAWNDGRSGGTDIYAQRVSAGGAVQWTADGVAICTDPNGQNLHGIASDGAHGAIAVWEDYRASSTDIYAQRVSAGGVVQWAANGLAVCTAASTQWHPAIVSDASGGAIMTWDDGRNALATGTDIYVQRVSGAGIVQWTADGIVLCNASGKQEKPAITSDLAHGAIVVWEDQRNGNSDLFARRVSAAGAGQWAANGVALCTAAGTQNYPAIVSDGAGGAMVAWDDWRNGVDCDIYAQTVTADGTPVQLAFVGADVDARGVALTWFAGGSPDVAATVYRCPLGGTWAPVARILADGTGYLRYSEPLDPAVARVGYRLGIVEGGVEVLHGETWVELPTRGFALDPVRPNPTQSGALTVRFTLPRVAPARLELLDVGGRCVVAREVGAAGAGTRSVELAAGGRLAPGVYLVRLTQGANERVMRVVVLE